MQVCNSSKRRIIILTFLLASTLGLTAESVESPSMPSMPQMPAISNPSLDGNFYQPSIPYHYGKKKTDENTNNATTSSGSILSDATTSDDIISSFLGTNSNLTANDISSLYDSGLFSQISSLTNLSTSLKSGQNESTNQLLQQVLIKLDELKNQQKNANYDEKNNLLNHQQDSKTFKQREPSVLRFKINGYSITESFTKVFFSEPESDGTFLLTADRKYFANQKPYEETVYILFRAVKSTGAAVIYNVQPSVVQTTKNENSYVYKLAQIKNLTAEKTGNLVVMHSDNNQASVDLLLDIDSN